MSDFVAGFAPRHVAAADAIARAFAAPAGFAAVAVGTPATGPKHFSPAAPGHKPCAGWNPLDPNPAITLAAEAAEEARAAGYAEGYAAALAEAETIAAAAQADGVRDRALLGDLGDALAARIDRAAMADRLRRTVLALTEKLVGEVGISADLLAGRIEGATELLADPSEPALLRVHPDDVALVEGRLPQSVFAAGDPHVARGSFVLESASTVVEDGPALWLEQLGAAIDRVPLPPC